jgi:RNA polymerase sigma factor (TIGR02999 family)
MQSRYHARVPDISPSQVTQILCDVQAGSPQAAERLLPLVYEQLRAIARRNMQQERAEHTLQATALVHEAYLRLVGDHNIEWDSRGHFYVAAAEAMRRILIEHARSRGRVKRGGERRRVPLTVVDLAAEDDGDQIMAVDEAFRRLEEVDPDAAKVVRLRFYAGLSVEETAAALGISPRSVAREWAYARAWLHGALAEHDS